MGNLVGNSAGNLMENAAGNSARNAGGNLMGNLAGNPVGGGKEAYLRKAVIDGNLAFGMDDGELTNQHPVGNAILWEILWDMVKEKKAVIGGNLAFGVGDGKLTNQHPAWEILQEILQEMLQEKLWVMGS